MMNVNLKWAVLGAVLGFSTAVGLACGPANKCTPTNCPFGCCDASGTCQGGSSPAQCGSQGKSCQACALGQVCQVGSCVQSTSGTGGGFSGSGGGTSSNGGGTGSTGGGGGSSNTGGGGGSSGTAICAQLSEATTSWQAGGTVCESSAGTITVDPNAYSKCVSGISACSSGDQVVLGQWADCILAAPSCTPGNETAAVQGFNSCLGPVFTTLSTSCRSALFTSSTGGGGGTNTGGGGGTNTGGGTATGGGGGTSTCTTLNFTSPPARPEGFYGNDADFEYSSAVGFSSPTDPTDLLTMEVVWRIGTNSTGALANNTVSLTNTVNYANCAYCVKLLRTCTENVSTAQFSCTGGRFLATGGTMTVGAVGRDAGSTFTGTLSSARFIEWDFTNDMAVAGGRCIIIPSYTVSNVTLQ